jgi:signal transduction histidine kinase
MQKPTSGADAHVAARSPRWLRPVLMWSLLLSSIFCAIEVYSRFVAADPQAVRLAVILGGFILAEIAAIVVLHHDRVGAAASIFAWAMLAVSATTAWLTTYITPALMLLPLLAMAVGLPFLRGRGLLALLVGACATELEVTLSALRFLPMRGPAPELIQRLQFVVSTVTIALIIAFLLEQFSRGIRSSLDEARSEVAAREEFMSMASHELQTPLTVLKLQLQRLAKAAPPGSNEAVGARLRDVDTQVTRLSRAVNNMLDLSRLSARKLVLEQKPVHLDAVVRTVIDELKPMAELTGSPVELKVVRPAVGLGDPLRVAQAVSNLLSNAIKYGEGKPIEVTVDEVEPTAEVSIRDHGRGIAPELLGKLFVQFERGPRAGSQSGMGLGLYITRQLLEAMGGVVRVTSRVNEGATFTIALPSAPAAGASGLAA